MFTYKNLKEIADITASLPNLVILAILSSLSYSFMAIFANINLIYSFLTTGSFSTTLTLTWSLITGFSGTVSFYGHAAVILLSILIALNLVIVIEVIRKENLVIKQSGSFLGIVLAPAASLCSVCVTGLAFAGFSISFAFLPFGGTEISVFAIMLLTSSLFWNVSKSSSQICKV